MLVAQKDLRKVLRSMQDALSWGGTSVVFKEREIHPEDRRPVFAVSYNDVSEFLAGQPYDSHEFVTGNLRSYFEAASLVEKRRIPVGDFAERYPRTGVVVDLGKIVETRDAAERLEWAIHRETIHAGRVKSSIDNDPKYRKELIEANRVLIQSKYGMNLGARLFVEHADFFHRLAKPGLSSEINSKHMNEKNLADLEKKLLHTGYGTEHNKELREEIQKQNPAFTLYHQQDYGKDATVSSLHFKKGENSDAYFFNSHTIIMKNDQHPDAIRQKFFINYKGDNITLKEGYNLLAGRAVEKELENKEGEKYRAWLQLNFKETDKHGNYVTKQYHEKYGFDLEKKLLELPLKLENPDEKNRLMESLQRGNRQTVTLNLQGQERKIAIEAAPQFKSLNYYDEHGKRLSLQSVLQTPQQAFGERQTNQSNTVTQKNHPSKEPPTKEGEPAQKVSATTQTSPAERQPDQKESKALTNSQAAETVKKGQKEKQTKRKRLQP